MNDQNKYSDEYISAYIDGELDNDERARLLFDEQQDATLTQRINDARILKEKVQLAFFDIENTQETKEPFSCTAFVSRHRTLVASLLLLSTIVVTLTYTMSKNDNLIMAKQLIKNTQPIAANAITDAVGAHNRVVINVSQYQPQNFSETINHIEALLQQRDNNKSFNVEIVANGQGLEALDSEKSVHAERIDLLAKQFNNLEVIACAASLTKLATDGNPVQLMKSIMITPSAAQQVAKRTGDGWLYIKI